MRRLQYDCATQGSFLARHDLMTRNRPISLTSVAAFCATTLGGAGSCLAQMPATPVLQNAWANAGITIAADYAKAQNASAIAGALAWAPTQSRFQLSAGAGVVRADSGGSQGAYGGRLSITSGQTNGLEPVLVLSHRLWQSLGADPAWVGAILKVASDRCVWGSDWPHTPPHDQHMGSAVLSPYRSLRYETLVDDFLAATDSAELAERILSDNPARLYGFD